MSDNTSGLQYIDAGLNDVDAWDGEVQAIHPGEYTFEVTEVSGGTSTTGNPKMMIRYQVVEAVGDKAEENADMVGRTVLQSYSLNMSKDATRRRLKSLVNALLGGPDAKGGFDPNALMNAQMVGEVKIETYSVPDALTQEPQEKQSTKIVRERSIEDYFGAEDAQAPANGAASAPEPEAEPEPEPTPEPAAVTASAPGTASAPTGNSSSRGRGRRRTQPTA